VSNGNAAERRIEISVRELVELTCRRGDITRGQGPRASALEGVLAHRAIQEGRGGAYRAEHRLDWRFARGGVVLAVSGRADGVDTGRDPPLVEEIKSVATPLILLHEAAHPLHFAQAEAYAAMLAAETGAAAVRVRLTYVHRESMEVRSFERTRSAAELAATLEGAAGRLVERIEIALAHRRERDASVAGMPFPYAAFRPGQRELAEEAAASIARGGTLLAHVPTGAGKTMAILFGALSALRDGAADQILYLTSRGTGRRAADKALADLRGAGLACTSLALTARDAICPNPGAACDAAECALARGHFDRVDAAAAELLSIPNADRAAVEAVAARHRVCPFALSLELAPYSDVVIGDLNYALDPHVSPKVMQGFTLGRRVALIDEAHNAVDRAREMFSARLSAREARAAAADATGVDPRIAKAARAIAAALDRAANREIAEGASAAIVCGAPKGVVRAAERYVAAAEIGLASRPAIRAAAGVSALYFRALGFLYRAERLDAGFSAIASREGRAAAVELYCVDPAEPIRLALEHVAAAVFFSGTLAPLDYFARTLGGGRARAFVGRSPFPAENLLALLADRVDTRFAARGATLDRVVELVAAAARVKAGSYLVFFPSYEYLTAAADRLSKVAPDLEVVRQAPGMDEAARGAFIAAFDERTARSRAVFAVLGGAFGESVDLPEGRVAGAIAVTVGLPPPDPRREAIRAHFDAGPGLGFEHAYAYPGANKVLQALGRVIRSETDRGFALLVDDRLRREPYRTLLAGAWPDPVRISSAAQLADRLREFWGG
jgi:DNA excision repair protein ERCC-2